MKVDIKSDSQFIIILRDIIVPIGTLMTLFLLYGTLREYQKTNRINIGKEIFERHLRIIDNIKSHILMDRKFSEITKSIPFKSSYSNHFAGMNYTFWGLITFINSDVKFKDFEPYLERLNNKDETLYTCKDDIFLDFNDRYKKIFEFLNYVSSNCKYFVNVIDDIINDKDILSDEQYNFLIKYVNDYISGYYTLCEEKTEFRDVYFINDCLNSLYPDGKRQYFCELFRNDFDSHYKLIEDMLKKIPIKRTFNK
jgi:hypothetical protein